MKRAPTPVPTGAVRPVDSGLCHNCDTPVSGHYCSNCGQATRLHYASAREFLHEFIGHFIAFEGRLAQTMFLLMFKPGKLTTEYIAGRRARYVQPLRLYLTLSVLFFALLKYSGVDLLVFDKPQTLSQAPAAVAKRSADDPPWLTPQRRAQIEKASQPDDDADERININTDLDKIYPKWGAKVHEFSAMGKAEQRRALLNAFYSNVPYALFCLMPIFALYLKLLYLGTGRRYGEHLLFALHTNAFAFVVFGLVMMPWAPLKGFLQLWLAAYLPVAMRRAYGGRWSTTIVRWLVLMAFFMLTMVMVIMAAIFLSVVL